MSNEFTPVVFPQATTTLNGRELFDNEKNLSETAVKDIPCYKDGTVIITQWQLKGFWNRLQFMFNGKVNLIALGISQPPISLRIDDPFVSTNEKGNG